MASSKRIGITGAKGFIGKNLVDFLSGEYDIVQFPFDYPGREDLFNYSEKDFANIDTIIHLAGTPRAKDSFKKNFELTKHILECSINAGCKNFYLASSYSVYGNRETPAGVGDELNPIDEYSLSKVLSEYLLKKEHLNGKISGKILRFCSIYGDGGSGLIDILKRRITNKEDIILDSNFQRNYLHVLDLVSSIKEILNKNDDNLVYNFTGERTSTEQLYHLFAEKDLTVKFDNVNASNFLCNGNNIITHNVEDYLFNNNMKDYASAHFP
jgi:nucleoside-diphosphate-sugar epimerase